MSNSESQNSMEVTMDGRSSGKTALRVPAANRSGWLKFVAAGVCLMAVLALAILSVQSLETRRRTEAKRQLDRLHSQYVWLQANLASGSSVVSKRQLQLVQWLGKPARSGIAMVRIATGHPRDEDLRCLQNLPELRAVELVSDNATDQTLALLSRLPNLRYLTVAGSRFTAKGLLELRKAQALKQLQIDRTRYSPIELAVLQAEIPQTVVAGPELAPTQPRKQFNGYDALPAVAALQSVEPRHSS